MKFMPLCSCLTSSCWTEGSGPGRAPVKHKECERAAAVRCQPAGPSWTSLSWDFPHKRGFLFLTHPEKMITAVPEHHRVKTTQLRKKPYCTPGRSCMVLHNLQKTSEMSSLLALEISTQNQEHVLRNATSLVWKAIRATQHCCCSPLDQAQKQQQL